MYKNREPYFIFPVISIKHLQQSLVNNSLMGGRVSFECHGQKSILQITEFQVCIWALYYNLEYQKIKMSRQCNLMNHAQHIWVCVCSSAMESACRVVTFQFTIFHLLVLHRHESPMFFLFTLRHHRCNWPIIFQEKRPECRQNPLKIRLFQTTKKISLEAWIVNEFESLQMRQRAILYIYWK